MASLMQTLKQSIRQVQRQRKPVERKSSIPPLRAISRVEKMADRTAWREVLECGHYGELTFGPNRQWIALQGQTNSRRCEECGKGRL